MVKFAYSGVDAPASPVAAVWRMVLDLYLGNDLMIFNANSEEPTLRCYEYLSELIKQTLALVREGLEQRFFPSISSQRGGVIPSITICIEVKAELMTMISYLHMS